MEREFGASPLAGRVGGARGDGQWRQGWPGWGVKGGRGAVQRGDVHPRPGRRHTRAAGREPLARLCVRAGVDPGWVGRHGVARRPPPPPGVPRLGLRLLEEVTRLWSQRVRRACAAGGRRRSANSSRERRDAALFEADAAAQLSKAMTRSTALRAAMRCTRGARGATERRGGIAFRSIRTWIFRTAWRRSRVAIRKPVVTGALVAVTGRVRPSWPAASRARSCPGSYF